MSQNSLDDLNEELYQITSELLDEGHKPFAVAAMYSMIAMQLYKTIMSNEEYNAMIDYISDNRDKVKKLSGVESFVMTNHSDSVH